MGGLSVDKSPDSKTDSAKETETPKLQANKTVIINLYNTAQSILPKFFYNLTFPPCKTHLNLEYAVFFLKDNLESFVESVR